MKRWITFAATQLIGFSAGAYFVSIDSDFVFWIWGLMGLVGFVLAFAAGSSGLAHSGSGQYLFRLIVMLVASSTFWIWVIALCLGVRLTRDSSLMVSMFFLWWPALTLWSVGWYSWLILGVVEEEKTF